MKFLDLSLSKIDRLPPEYYSYMTSSVMLDPTENNHLCKSLTGKDMKFLLQIIFRASLILPHDILKVFNFLT